MLIGIIGEDPFDTTAIKHLMERRFPLQFRPILKQIKGDMLTTAKTRRLLKIELKKQSYKVIIYTKDLDGLDTETQKKKKIVHWFNQLDTLNKNTGILLINIYELEALILADIETFNRIFSVNVPFRGNPMYKKEPKEYLITSTRKSKRRFQVSDNPEIFKYLRLEKLIENCSYFREFVTAFQEKIK